MTMLTPQMNGYNSISTIFSAAIILDNSNVRIYYQLIMEAIKRGSWEQENNPMTLKVL